jgi:hypothetical protein
VKDTEQDTALLEFVGDVLRSVGGQVALVEGVLEASLPAEDEGAGAELVRRLGRSELKLVSRAARVDAEHELVAPGSHVLRVLEEYLDEVGARSYLVTAPRARLSLKALALSAGRGERFKLDERAALVGHDLYVVYRVRYRARDRRDAVITIRVELRPGLAPKDPPDALAEPVAEVPAALFALENRARKRVAPDLLRVALGAADEAVARVAHREAGVLQEEVRKSFKKDLSRLHAYYAGQIAEYMRRRTSDLNVIRVEELEEERAVRVKELIHSSEVRGDAEPIQLLMVELPLQRARLQRLTKAGGEVLGERWVQFDRSRGSFELGEESLPQAASEAPGP